jgi:hypothetical protein
MFSKACVCKEKVLYTHIKFTRNLSPKMKKTIQQQHLVPFGVHLKALSKIFLERDDNPNTGNLLLHTQHTMKH